MTERVYNNVIFYTLTEETTLTIFFEASLLIIPRCLYFEGQFCLNLDSRNSNDLSYSMLSAYIH